ncbi:hypothetical protein K490DRAFT_66408 [Saccharata proteae CBS 121410]|uniref:Uncharacterized protein n=1 Tax=Saccharata proteae CBS 121410 TaxID=1314787 RepID=A0A9P4LUL0_9PEZI|nr:hypothetical protein K490DRAFT_66408 [Saccharata proteae CBS 121410]
MAVAPRNIRRLRLLHLQGHHHHHDHHHDHHDHHDDDNDDDDSSSSKPPEAAQTCFNRFTRPIRSSTSSRCCTPTCWCTAVSFHPHKLGYGSSNRTSGARAGGADWLTGNACTVPTVGSSSSSTALALERPHLPDCSQPYGGSIAKGPWTPSVLIGQMRPLQPPEAPK